MARDIRSRQRTTSKRTMLASIESIQVPGLRGKPRDRETRSTRANVGKGQVHRNTAIWTVSVPSCTGKGGIGNAHWCGSCDRSLPNGIFGKIHYQLYPTPGHPEPMWVRAIPMRFLVVRCLDRISRATRACPDRGLELGTWNLELGTWSAVVTYCTFTYNPPFPGPISRFLMTTNRRVS